MFKSRELGSGGQKFSAIILENILFLNRRMSNEEKNKRQSYKKITEEVREGIIERILNNGENIKEVSASMNVNISTCKAILKVYQDEGRIGKKKKRNKVVNVIETFSFYCINDGNFDQVQPVKIQQSKISLNRNQNLDKTLEDNAKDKADKMLDQIIANKKKSEEEAAEMQRQLQLIQNNYAQFFMHPFMLNSALVPTILPQVSPYSSQSPPKH